jgi:hypothetical protein
MEKMVYLMGYDRSKHIEGGLASLDLLHHIDVEKCALWALPSGNSCI